MEIHEFESRDFSILAAFLAFAGYQDCDARNKTSKGQIEQSTKKTKKRDLAAKSPVSGYGELIVATE